ncbi:transposase [Burkholderia pseudomallei]|nr:transposase [Burkholderia pseudomallei]ARK71974.1 transposase [Burkholderia pseudomallei]ARK74894.1 transposase [Burkholderia pseudomallei]ARK85674.1 transposase [Burkholderia pseudomallei]ARK92756.1 transposase [Burkholderia pseudomallei]
MLMRRIDELHMEFPFAGARMLARPLRREGHEVGRRRVRTLMQRMGVEALYCKPNTSRRNAQHKIWPYLLRGMKIDRPNQVFALDTTYIPMARGCVYLTAVVDWASRKILAHRAAITLEASHAVEAPEVPHVPDGHAIRSNRSAREREAPAISCRLPTRSSRCTCSFGRSSRRAATSRRTRPRSN